MIRSVKFNALMNVILMGSNTLISLITLPYVTRVLSVTGYGAVGFAQSAAAWFSTFCMMGIPVYGIRECARARDQPRLLAKTVKELLVLLSMFTGVVLSVFAICIVMIPRFQQDSTLLWIFFVNTLIASYGLEWFYQAMEQYAYITIRSAVFKLLSLALILVCVRHPDDAIVYGVILAFVTSGNNVFNVVHLHSMVSLSDADSLDLRRHLKPIMSFGVVNIAASVYLSLDAVILGFLTSGNYQVGLYQLASKLKGFLGSVITAVTSAAIPRLSYYMTHNDLDKYHRLLGNSLSLLTNIGLCMVGYLVVFSDCMVPLISSAKYLPSAPVLQIISVAMFLSVINALIGFQILTPAGQESKLAIANSAGVPVSIIANFALDPYLGAMGAAIAASATELMVFVVQAVAARKVLRQVADMSQLLRIVVSVATACAVSLVVRHLVPGWSSLEIIAGSIISYFAVWLVLLVVSREKSTRLVMATVTRRFHK